MQELTIKQKLINYYYFIAVNSLLLALLGIGYFIRNPSLSHLLLPENNDLIAILYIITTHFIHVLLYLFTASLLLLPTLFLENKKRIIIQLCLIIIVMILAILDVFMFYKYQINITDTFVSVYYNSVVIDLPTNLFSFRKCIFLIGFVFFCWAEYILIVRIDKKNMGINNFFCKKYFLLIIACIISTTAIYINGDKTRRQNLVAYIQHLPWVAIGDKQIIKKIYNINKQLVLTKFTNFISSNNKKLNYPIKPLITHHITNPPNILIIAIDAWRADCFNEIDSPNLWRFAQTGKIFINHKSTSNATLGGIFGLFYSVPSSYWHNFLENKCIPVLFDRLQQLDYQIGMFTASSSPLEYFIKQKNLPYARLDFKINANESHEKDKLATNSLLRWHEALNKKNPWFAFIFYASAHDHNFPDNYSNDYKPVNNSAVRYAEIVNKYDKNYFINSYKLGLHYADNLASKILQQITESNDLSNTIVIITSDHGREMNETNQNQWGHGSNFTDYQMQVPFAIVGPKFNSNELNWQKTDLTTNYDIVPTLMHDFLGVTNDTSDYSIGVNLLGDRKVRDWMLATGYSHYSVICSIIDNKGSFRWIPSGRHWFTDNMNRFLTNKSVDKKLLDQALEYTTRFIKK